jgi:hypothetical protein
MSLVYPELELYYDSIFKFCNSLVIKYDILASHIANLTKLNTGKITVHDNENPYYLNLAGEYADHQEILQVRDPLTDTMIPFTKETLTNHKLLRSLYTIGSDYTEILLDANPTYHDVIRGIIIGNITLTDVLNAPDFTILYSDTSSLHPNEIPSIMNYLNTYLELFSTRWFIKEYAYEELYPLLAWGIFWANLPLMLLARRALNIRTSTVHPFHIWEYLGSKGLLDYQTAFTAQQELFLYQNIDFLLTNRGKQQNLQILIDGLLSKTTISMTAKTIGLNTENSTSNIDNITPSVFDTPIDTTAPILNKFHTYADTIPDFLDGMIYHEVADSSIKEDLDEQLRRWKAAPSTVLHSKFLELKNTSPLDPHRGLFFNLILGMFLHYMNEDKLAYFVDLTIEEFDYSDKIDTKTAFVLLCYMIGILLLKQQPDNVAFPNKLFTFPNLNTNADLTNLNYVDIIGQIKPIEEHIRLISFLDDFPEQPAYFSTNTELVEYIFSLFKVMVMDIDTLSKHRDLNLNLALSSVYDKMLISTD